MAIPFIDLKAQYEELKPLIEERIKAVLEHGRYILGPEVRELEERLARYVGVKHAIGCSSGTDALLLLLMAYGGAIIESCVWRNGKKRRILPGCQARYFEQEGGYAT